MKELCEAALRIGKSLAKWNADQRFAGRQIGTQFKAEVDKWAHDLWSQELEVISPGTAVVSEEDEQSFDARRGGTYWLIDPLDGTASFVEKFPGWVTQAALMEDHQPVASVVFAPLTEDLYFAELGKGALCNGQRLTVDPAAPVKTLVDNYPEPRGIAASTMDQFGISEYLESGSLGLKICRVASGDAEIFVKDVPVKSWDVAMGDLILSEAGGKLTTLSGDPPDYRCDLQHSGLIACHSASFCSELAEWAAGPNS